MLLLAEQCIQVGTRNSPLALEQCREVLDEMRRDHPDLDFDLIETETTGDLDRATSLRALDKCDFFTKEIDAMLLEEKCRIAIHSAKDLPEPLPEGIHIVALTRGVDSSDSLVLQEGTTLASLPQGACIATSSERREEAVRQLRPDLTFCDIRGTIAERLTKLESGEIAGVVIAEAALIRLKLTHLNRVRLPGETAALQGRLAILAREDDTEMEALFSCIDSRERCLYLGIDLPDTPYDTKFIHYPLIRPIPRDPNTPEIDEALTHLESFTHIIFTSKSAVRLFFCYLQEETVDGITCICVGSKTAAEARKHGATSIITASTETAEGVIELLKTLDLTTSNVLWPHSALSRPLINHYLTKHAITHTSVVIYDTIPVRPSYSIDPTEYDGLYFTSPSTVDAYASLFGALPQDKELHAIGPVTREALGLYAQNPTILQ